MSITSTEISERLDALSVGRFHRRVIITLSCIFFFELADLSTLAYAGPGLREHLGITLDEFALINSAGFLGMFLGATFGGRLADRVGRRPALICAVSTFSVFSALNGAGWNAETLALARFLTGCGLSFMVVTAITYLAEVVPSTHRGRLQAAVTGCGIIGIPVIAFVALATVPHGSWGWRVVFLFGGLGLVFVPWVARLPESPRWLAERGRVAEAEQAVATIEGESGAGATPVTARPPAPPADAQGPPPRTARIAELFAAGTRTRTIMLIAVWCFQTLGYYGFVAWVPTLLAAHGYSIANSLLFTALAAIGAVPGAFLAWPISDRFGRKLPIALITLVIAACGVSYGLSRTALTIVLFGLLVNMLTQTFIALLYAYTPEHYPTALRNTGTGISYGAGRLANICGSFIVAAIFGSFGYVWVFVYIAGCWTLVSLAVALFGARTERRPLERLNRR
ncbi:MFS transporter [Pseudonocardia acaciae]|uniref:MFS transporter n=1 Tax=Pseudonocardia acaciae TaxID=551276 RepID=UPI00056631D4|nr:MFS transporter [Pseudonocardia acaciae]